MDDIESKIDALERDKLVSLIQENAVRIKRIKIKFTKFNKKDSLEHWQKYYESYDRLIRNIPKEIFRIEREVRAKFLSDLTPERVLKLKSFINSEAQLQFEKLEKECGIEFQKMGHQKDFEDLVQKTRLKVKKGIEEQLEKCEQVIKKETSESGKLKIDEVCKIYNIKESILHELNILEVLQDINIAMNKMREKNGGDSVVNEIQSSFREMLSNIQNETVQTSGSVEARKLRKIQVARESLMFRDLMVNCQYMLSQAVLSRQPKNMEIIGKIWSKIEEILETGRKDWSQYISKFEKLFQFIQE